MRRVNNLLSWWYVAAMKYLMVILFLLSFSSSVFADLPTSLFGIKLNEEVEKYKITSSGIEEDKRLCNKKSIPDQKVSGEFVGFTSEVKEINLMKNNPFFDSQCIYFNNESSLITRISGSTFWTFFNDLEEGNQNRYGLEETIKIHSKVIKTLSTLYDIEESKFREYYFFKQSETVVDDTIKFSPQTLTIIHLLDFEVNDYKTQLYVHSEITKMVDPQEPKNNLNILLGNGFFHIGLVNEMDENYDFLKERIAQAEDEEINVLYYTGGLEKYVELMKSVSSSF